MRKRLVWVIGIVVSIVVAVAAWGSWRLHASLAILDGALVVAGIGAEVKIERDSAGVPTVTAASREDAAFALGFLHAQERFFQMDLLRRQPAGRLSELFGEVAVESDRAFRRHRFSELARVAIKRSEPKHRELLEAYTRGVNAGLSGLGEVPFEYLFLRCKPEVWRVEDCALVAAAMLCELQDENGTTDYEIGKLKQCLPEAAFRFLFRKGTPWDAPLIGPAFPDPPIPPPERWSLRGALSPPDRESMPANQDAILESPRPPAGSNGWAVEGRHTTHGRAILSSDMHLGHAVPNVWYRAVIERPGADGNSKMRIVGVTLPGVPAIVAGSNGSVAWGLTNAAADFGDLIQLQLVDPDHYMTPDGPQRIETMADEIKIKGVDSRRTVFRWTRWGPIVIEDPQQGVFAHRWVGNDREAADFGFLDMEDTTTVHEAIEVANRCGVAHSNLICADSSGNIGWTILGRIPERTVAPPRWPVDWSEEEQWSGYLTADQYPRIIGPESGILWSANQRAVGAGGLRLLGDGGYDLGARAGQIRDRLNQDGPFDEKAMLRIQLDDEALLLRRWRDLLWQVIHQQQDTVSDAFADYVEHWGGRASVDSVGYRIVHRFRQRVIKAIWQAIAESHGFSPESMPLEPEGFVWQMTQAQPQHLLPSTERSWSEFLGRLAAETESDLASDGGLTNATWGRYNRVAIRHPLSRAVPWLSPWLDMPTRELPGDGGMPRVQRPNFGASERMVVSPGHEEQALFHMPGGQSGHPRSPFYRTGFDDWAEGRATPLLPGPTQHVLVLKPK